MEQCSRARKRVASVGVLALAAWLGSGNWAVAQVAPPSAPSADPQPTPLASTSPSLSELFKGTVTDFRKLRSRDTLAWFSIGAAASLVGHFEDRALTRSLSGSDQLGDVLASGRIIGGVPVQMGGALATFAIGRMMNSPRATTVGADLFRAQALAQTMVFAGKLAVRRTRPDEGRFSFPSGHTAISFASATVLHRDLGWKVGIPAYAVASYIAASRIQSRRHYLSDVAFGAAVGIMAGRAVTLGSGNMRFAVTPMAAPGGAGVSFAWVGKP